MQLKDTNQTGSGIPTSAATPWLAEFARMLKLCIACLALLWTLGVISYVASGHVARIAANRGLVDALPGFAIAVASVAMT